MEKEIWRDIPGYEGLYQASSLGRIKSLDRKQSDKFGKIYNYKSKILKPRAGKGDGRLAVVLSKNGVTKGFNVHSLIAESFLGTRPEGYFICHCDGNNQNNNIENLRYDTSSQNGIDIYRHGGKAPLGVLTPEDVVEIRNKKVATKCTNRKLAEEYNVSPTTICDVLKRKTFSWLNDDGTINESKTQIK